MNSRDEISKAQKKRLTLLTAYYLMARYDPFFTDVYRRKVVRLLALHRSKILADLSSAKISRAQLRKAHPEAYPLAIPFASDRMGRRPKAFPAKCPVALATLLNWKSVPKAKMLPFSAWQPTSGAEISSDWAESGFHVTRLDQDATGLPMVIWALESFICKDVCAVLVASMHQTRRKTQIRNGVLVSVGPKPKVLFDGKLLPKDQALAANFIGENRRLLRQQWAYKENASSLDLIERLKPLM